MMIVAIDALYNPPTRCWESAAAVSSASMLGSAAISVKSSGKEDFAGVKSWLAVLAKASRRSLL
jgi:hypothetical protein